MNINDQRHSPLAALPTAGPEQRQARLEQAAEQFEALFLQQMLKQMRKAGDVLAADNPMRSRHTETLRDFHDQALADSLARRRQGGIAELLIRQLSPAPAPVPAPPPQASTPQGSSLEVLANRVFGPIVEGWNATLKRGAASFMRLVERVIAHESGGRVAAVSPKGARGLMQLMPDTAREVAADLGLPYSEQRLVEDGAYNKRLGSAYLSKLLARYDGEQALALAAYNAGPGRVDEWLARHGDPRQGPISVQAWVERIPFEETRRYTRAILADLHGEPPAPRFNPKAPEVALGELSHRTLEDYRS